jgi:hypothetical protein
MYYGIDRTEWSVGVSFPAQLCVICVVYNSPVPGIYVEDFSLKLIFWCGFY